MRINGKKNIKSTKKTSPTDNIKKLNSLMNQLEEHIIKRYKFPNGLPSTYAEYCKPYLPAPTEIICEEITESDRKWFYEQLDQGLLNESPEQYAIRQQAWRLPPPLLRSKSEIYIYIPQEDRLARHYGEIATQIREFKKIISTIKVRVFKEKEEQAEKHFKEAFRLYAEHYDCSFYVYNLPKDIYDQIKQSQLARNSHKQSHKVKKAYLSIVQGFINSNTKTYSSIESVLGAIDELASSKIPKYLIDEYKAEIKVCRKRKEEVDYYLFGARTDLSTAVVERKEQDGREIVTVIAKVREQPLNSFAGRPIERYKEMSVSYQKKIYDLETKRRKFRTLEQRMKLLNRSKSWLKEDRPDLYDALKSFVKKANR